MTGAFGDVPDRDMAPGDVDLDRVWLGVATAVWQRRPGSLERLAGWLLRSPGLARALLITPSLLLPWLLASAAVLAAGAAATLGTGEPLVTLLAPGVAAAGIAYAYGPGIARAVGECGRGRGAGRLGDHGPGRAGRDRAVHRRRQ